MEGRRLLGGRFGGCGRFGRCLGGLEHVGDVFHGVVRGGCGGADGVLELLGGVLELLNGGRTVASGVVAKIID